MFDINYLVISIKGMWIKLGLIQVEIILQVFLKIKPQKSLISEDLIIIYAILKG